MSSYGLNGGMETPVPLNGIVNNALLNTSPNINQTLPQIVHILCTFVYRLADAPDLVVNWSVIGVVRRHKSGEMNAGVWW